MHAVMVDTCVLLDIVTQDTKWYDWSSTTLQRVADEATLVINPIIYAELSIGFAQIEEMESLLAMAELEYHPLPREAAFLAGKSFSDYRRRGGVKIIPLPDFFIGAHASVESLPLLTRDVKRFRTYFPRLSLISP